MRRRSAAWLALATAGVWLACTRQFAQSDADIIRVRGLAAQAAAQAARRALAGSDQAAMTLTDATPRVDLPEATPDSQVELFLRGVQMRVPLLGLRGVKLTTADQQVDLELQYGDDLLTVSDRSAGQHVSAMVRRLLDSSQLALDAAWQHAGINGDGAQRWQAEVRQKRQRFEDELGELHVLVRSALRTEVVRASTLEAPDATYRSARLLLVKAQLGRLLSDTLGGKANLVAFASGPLVGLYGYNGQHHRVLWFGGDRMLVQIDSSAPPTGDHPAKVLVHSIRPFAPIEVLAARHDALAARGADDLRPVLARISAMGLSPSLTRLAALRNVEIGVAEAAGWSARRYTTERSRQSDP